MLTKLNDIRNYKLKGTGDHRYVTERFEVETTDHYVIIRDRADGMQGELHIKHGVLDAFVEMMVLTKDISDLKAVQR